MKNTDVYSIREPQLSFARLDSSEVLLLAWYTMMPTTERLTACKKGSMVLKIVCLFEVRSDPLFSQLLSLAA